MDLLSLEVLIGLSLALLFTVYYHLTSNFDYWKKRGVKGPKPVPLLGNFADHILGKIHLALLLKKYYEDYPNEQVVGLFARKSPNLLIRDLDLVRDVLVKDFNVFRDRGRVSKTVGKSNDPYSQNLFNLQYDRWRPLRSKLTPAFSGNKLKNMFYLIVECAEHFDRYVEDLVDKHQGAPIECQELTAKYFIDVIGVCVFGLNTNSLGDENSEFCKAGRQLVATNTFNILRRYIREWFPTVYNLLRPLVRNKALELFTRTMKDTMAYRKKNNFRREDFVDLLMDLKDQPEKLGDLELTDDLLVSQALVFFVAGFELSSTTMSNMMYELALNQDVQDKLRYEVKQIMNRDGKLTYENIKEMKYLDMVMKETLRMYPPGSYLNRQTSEMYTFSRTSVTVQKDIGVIIPVWAIHRDPALYPDPNKFDPERFTDENEKSRHPMAFLPFGDGPKNCIGDSRDDTVLHIGGIFPIAGEGGWQGGQACMPAANLALEDVNNKRDLLPGFTLKLHSNDSKCEPGLAASVMYNLLYNPPQKLMLLAGCSTVCTTVAEAAKMWNLVVLCYGASSPALSDRNRFPTLFRTHPSATVHNPTRVKLLQKFGWSRIAILQQAEEVFISTVEDLEARCKEADIEIVTRQSFLSDPSDAVRNLRRQDARIIVGLFYVDAARRVLCDIYNHNLYGKQYVWFFIGWYEDNWYEVNLDKEGITCTKEQMRTAADGHLTTEALMWNQNNRTTVSGMTSEEFRQRLNEVLKKEGYDIDNKRYPAGYQEAPLAYDAVWSVALAFNKTMDKLSSRGKSLKNFTYNDKEMADEIYSAVNSTQFTGISGYVAFSSQGDRIALTQIEQMIDGKYTKLGYYDTQMDNLTWRNMERWIGGKVPQDRTIIKDMLRTVSLPIFAAMNAVSCVGIFVALGLIVFNICNRHRRVIISSHPVCNTIMLVGVIACFVSVFLLGADGRFIEPMVYPYVCQARAWVLTIGFTLAFGAMFSKVWRVHRLNTKTKADHAKLFMAKQKISSIQKQVQPWKLYSMVGTLLVVDIVLLTVWQVLDPLQRKLENFPLEASTQGDDDARIRPQLEHCESERNYFWLGLVYGYKGVILMFGLFLAYETRSIKVKQINDSRYVGMSIYNVVVLCLVTAPVTLVIASQQDASFAFVSLAIIFCCFLSMALIFVPKVIEVIRHPKDKAESKYNPDMGISKEEEEKYQRLLVENEELQKLIAEKEEKIRSAKAKLAERDAARGIVSSGASRSGSRSGSLPKDSLIVADFVTGEGTSDSAMGAGISVQTRSSHASGSDFEFSESYL
ncbi:hypothetical protein QAD02_016625 [Eretmocerus hayati]|uniref:Uncharacterized protein n=1 Tax=Eretmocerus hayati TaxID=131215 RepID=A0ACC2PCN3_9HYME|nr:hypothetical protein QAD02_016625 [Eretmocerus hayati]